MIDSTNQQDDFVHCNDVNVESNLAILQNRLLQSAASSKFGINIIRGEWLNIFLRFKEDSNRMKNIFSLIISLDENRLKVSSEEKLFHRKFSFLKNLTICTNLIHGGKERDNELVKLHRQHLSTFFLLILSKIRSSSRKISKKWNSFESIKFNFFYF